MSDIVERFRWWGAKRRAPKNMPTLPADCAEGASVITALRQQVEELQAWSKTVTTSISDAIGLGSEMFRRHGEQYRIDPAFVACYIRDRREDHHNSMHRNITRIRQLEADLAMARDAAIEEAAASFDTTAAHGVWHSKEIASHLRSLKAEGESRTPVDKPCGDRA